MNPAEALRLSRADTLAKKHGCDGDGVRPGPGDYLFTVEQVAALIEEVTAPLRQQLNDVLRAEERRHDY